MNVTATVAALAISATCWQPLVISAAQAIELDSLAGEWVEPGHNGDMFFELDVLANDTFQLYPVRSYERTLRETFYYNKHHLNFVGKVDGDRLAGTASKSLGDCVYKAPFLGKVHAGGRQITIQWTAPACATAGATGQHAKNVNLRRP